MSNELKLYHSAASPNSRRVRIFLAEKGVAIPLEPVDLASAGSRLLPRGVRR
jgi:glutathione S-transferase